jgi:hypothetical protein
MKPWQNQGFLSSRLLTLILLSCIIVVPHIIAVTAYVNNRLVLAVPLIVVLPSRDDKEYFRKIDCNKSSFGDFQTTFIMEGGRQLNENKFVTAFKSAMVMFFVYFTEERSG